MLRRCKDLNSAPDNSSTDFPSPAFHQNPSSLWYGSAPGSCYSSHFMLVFVIVNLIIAPPTAPPSPTIVGDVPSTCMGRLGRSPAMPLHPPVAAVPSEFLGRLGSPQTNSKLPTCPMQEVVHGDKKMASELVDGWDERGLVWAPQPHDTVRKKMRSLAIALKYAMYLHGCRYCWHYDRQYYSSDYCSSSSSSY